MKRLIVSLLLSLFILLAGGFSRMAVHTSPQQATYSPVNNPGRSAHADLGALQQDHDFLSKSSSSRTASGDINMLVAENEEEDDRTHSSRQRARIFSHFISLLRFPAPDSIFTSAIKAFSHKYLTYSSSNRYILLEVFRI